MKISQKLVGLLIFGLPLIGSAQTQGDISHSTFQLSFTHDSTTCSSDIMSQNVADISNSFLGDSVKFIDFGGGVIYAEENTTGASFWSVPLPFPNVHTESDEMVSGGNLMTIMPPIINKIISGPDTLYFVNEHMVFEAIPDACAYNDVSGQVYIDNDNNCSFNTGDSAIFSLQVKPTVNFAGGPFYFGTSSGYTNTGGNYNITIQESWMTSYSIAIPSIYQFIFPTSTCTPLSYNFTTLPQTGVDFVLECANVDTYVVGSSGGNVHAALPFNFNPSVANIGCDQVSGVLKMVLDPNVTYNPANSSNPADYVVGDTLFWNYSNLNNISGGAYWNSFIGGVQLMPAPSVVTGDQLCFEIISDVPMNDVDPLNNSKTICVNVVAAYDPNIKYVEPAGSGSEGFIPASTSKLTYTVHFQNTGSADAINIFVIDSLEQNVIPSTLKILNASHTMTPEWLDTDIIQFNFDNIYLPDSTTNEPDSHGFVEFEIDMVQGLAEGTEIKNRAHIYFDNNPAVTTDYALNTIEFTFGVSENNMYESLVFPNPTTGVCYLKGINNVEMIEIMNMNGQVLFTTTSTEFDLSDFPKGVYFARIQTTENQLIEKVIKR